MNCNFGIRKVSKVNQSGWETSQDIVENTKEHKCTTAFAWLVPLFSLNITFPENPNGVFFVSCQNPDTLLILGEITFTAELLPPNLERLRRWENLPHESTVTVEILRSHCPLIAAQQGPQVCPALNVQGRGPERKLFTRGACVQVNSSSFATPPP